MSGTRPLIGITMRHELETERFYLARFYSEAIEAAGGIPVHLSLLPRPEYVSAAASKLDGVLLPGSASDVDPALYGREPHVNLGTVHPLRDSTDLLLLGEVERRGLPLLAICYGMQSLNVSRGGTLIQDIPSTLTGAIQHQQGLPRGRRSHQVKLLPGSTLIRLASDESAWVNSHHHQGIERLGEGLHATAWTSDGLIEAIEDLREDRWAIGVQWHPEMDWENDGFARAMFDEFVQASSNFSELSSQEILASEANAMEFK